jgi:hypothetical protein
VNPPDAIEPEGIFEGLSGSSIVLGVLVDIGLTTLVGILLVAWLAPEVFAADEAAATEALDALYASTTFHALELAVGSLCTLLGAFVGARRAGSLHVRHGGWIAVASAATGAIVMVLTPPDPSLGAVPFWKEALAWILILPAGVAGGALARAVETHDGSNPAP